MTRCSPPSLPRRLVERYATTHEADKAEAAHRPATAATVDRTPPPHRDLAPLTPREREVLVLMGRGLSNTELADTLTLSEATVKTHVARIFAKLTLRDRAQAVILAYETGLVTPGSSTAD